MWEMFSFGGKVVAPIRRGIHTMIGCSLALAAIEALTLLRSPIADGVALVLGPVITIAFIWMQTAMSWRVLTQRGAPAFMTIFMSSSVIIGGAGAILWPIAPELAIPFVVVAVVVWILSTVIIFICCAGVN